MMWSMMAAACAGCLSSHLLRCFWTACATQARTLWPLSTPWAAPRNSGSSSFTDTTAIRPLRIRSGWSSVHPGSPPNGLPPLQYFDLTGVVLGGFAAHDVPSERVRQSSPRIGEFKEMTRSEAISRRRGRATGGLSGGGRPKGRGPHPEYGLGPAEVGYGTVPGRSEAPSSVASQAGPARHARLHAAGQRIYPPLSAGALASAPPGWGLLYRRDGWT